MSGALLDFLNIFKWLTSTQRLSQGSLLLFSEERKRLGETLAGSGHCSGHVSVPLSQGKHRRLFPVLFCWYLYQFNYINDSSPKLLVSGP